MLAKLFLISLFTISCIESPFERDYRYDPNLISPCEITAKGHSLIQTNPASFDRLWKRGPYPIWNSSPSDACEKNLDYVTHGGKPVSLYITYPSRSNPQLSGDSIPAEGPFPVIIFGHANHDKKCSLYQSYYSLHDHWASWGFIVASYDGEEWNCQRGTKTNIRGRASLLEASIESLSAKNDDPSSIFYQKIDLGKVILAGHSRGGGAQYLALPNIDNVVGIINLQGINVINLLNYRPRVPTLGITAGRDVDLNYPNVEYMEDVLIGPYTWVNINGGVHAYTADDSPLEFDDTPKITKQTQHDLTKLYTTAFLMRYAGLPILGTKKQLPKIIDILESHKGSKEAETLSHLGVFQRWRPESPLILIDNFNEALDKNNLGGKYSTLNLEIKRTPTYSSNYPFFSRSLLMKTREREGSFTTNFPNEIRLNLEARIEFRVKYQDEGKPSSQIWVSLNGGEFVNAANFMGPIKLSNRFSQVSIPRRFFGTKTINSLTIKISSGSLLIDDLRVNEFQSVQ